MPTKGAKPNATQLRLLTNRIERLESALPELRRRILDGDARDLGAALATLLADLERTEKVCRSVRDDLIGRLRARGETQVEVAKIVGIQQPAVAKIKKKAARE